jgi:hypothetical protein
VKGRALGKPEYRWEDNINMDLEEVGCEDVNWIQLSQDSQVVGFLVNCYEHY